MLAGVGPVRDVLFVRRRRRRVETAVRGAPRDRRPARRSRRDRADEDRPRRRGDPARSPATRCGSASPARHSKGARSSPVSPPPGEGIDELREASTRSSLRPVRGRRERATAPPRRPRVHDRPARAPWSRAPCRAGSWRSARRSSCSRRACRARIRGLQSHERPIDRAVPVSRVAVNLAGIDRIDRRAGRRARPPGWLGDDGDDRRASRRRCGGSVTRSRGGARTRCTRGRPSSTRDCGSSAARAWTPERHGTFARLRLAESLVFDMGDPIVIRDAGRRETVAGGRDARPATDAREGERHDRTADTPRGRSARCAADAARARTRCRPGIRGVPAHRRSRPGGTGSSTERSPIASEPR